jgi:mono/diheme cytochrome c family protein/glucose/arabinose dehydrogenase
MKKRNYFLCFLFAFASIAHAQIGDKLDKPGEKQIPLVPKEMIPPSPARSAADEMKTFKLAPGLRIELVASEPLVEDPVTARFDHEGKLWVVEMRGFMNNFEGSNEDAPIGRVVILTDTNRDGKMDTSTVFLDGLILPRAVMPVAGGALVGAPPYLWFCRDTNGDGKCDEKIEIASDYGVQVDPKRPELANPERAPNNPLWNLDNWIYSASYMTRLRYVGGEWKKGLTIFRGQYGLSQDDAGHLFYDSNSDQLRGDIIPSEYLSRNPNFRPAGNNVNIAQDQFVWPARVNPGVNRGYQPKILRDGKLKEFTAANSPFIFRGDLFPKDFYNNAFVCEPAGNLVRRNIMFPTNGSLHATNAYDHAEFLASTDERFRPVNLTSGPDGALYIVDFYRGVLEHRISLTTYLRKQGEDRGLEKPIHLGRIYRVVPEGKTIRRDAPTFAKETPAQWVKALSHPNGWHRDTAQRLLVEKRDLSVVPALKKLALNGKNPLGKVHALWTLEGLNALDLVTVEKALRDKNPQVRVAAIRVSEPALDSEDGAEMTANLLALTNETVAEVQLRLALTLGQAHDEIADVAMARLTQSPVPNLFLSDAVLSGVAGRELQLLEKIVNDPEPKSNARNFNRVLSGLASCIVTSRNAERVNHLLDLIAATKSPSRQQLLLDGIASTSGNTSKKPVKLHAEPAALAALEKSSNNTIQVRAKKVSALLTWPGKPGAQPEVVVAPLSPEDQKRFEEGKRLFAGSCAACHQLHGMGMDGLAPPLVDSEWVLGSEQRLTRIVLNGLTGPLRVKGAGWHLDMPSMGMFDDEQIAAILTYIRREWDNTGSPVQPETVKKIRAANASRQEAWSQAELLEIP